LKAVPEKDAFLGGGEAAEDQLVEILDESGSST
jgi:hypothetical protein